MHRSSRSAVSKIDLLQNFSNFTGKHLCRGLFFSKVAILKACNFVNKRLQHRCFPVKFAKNLRTIPVGAINSAPAAVSEL